MASLRWFISPLGEKALLLYRLLKKSDKFIWTDEVKLALADIKHLLGTNPILVVPCDNKLMLLYISVTN